MAAHNWTFDAPSGVYRNNFISNKLLETAVAKLKVVPFTFPFDGGFGKNKGEYVNVYHLKELPDPTSAQLEENTRIPIDKLQMGARVIRVVEWGRGVEYTDLAEQLSKFKPSSYLQKALTRQMERAMDTNAANAFQDSAVKICFIPTGISSGTFDTDGTPSTVATAAMSFDHMGILADYMAGNIHCPPFRRR